MAPPLTQIEPLILNEQGLLFLVVVGEQLLVEALLLQRLLLEGAEVAALCSRLVLDATDGQPGAVEIQVLAV